MTRKNLQPEKSLQPGKSLHPEKNVQSGKAAKRDLPLRGFFVLTVFVAFSVVVLLSGLTIAGCMAFRHYLLPDEDAAYLTIEQVTEDGMVTSTTILLNFGEQTDGDEVDTETPEIVFEGGVDYIEESSMEGDNAVEDGFPTENDIVLEVQTELQQGQKVLRTTDHEKIVDTTYSIQKLERSYDTLTPKRKLAWQLCGAAMVIVPAILSIGGILFCGFFFYRKRLALPLQILSDATKEIAAQNLDFTLEYDCGDEMGQLCRSFEMMRRELAENNREMWNLVEQRRMMQASIAHDLRNPIAIIQGYTEYLQIHLPEGKLSREKTGRIVGNLNMAAKRLEQYTESVRTLNQLEDMEIRRKEISLAELVADIRDDFEVIAVSAGITLHVNGFVQSGCLKSAKDANVPFRAGICSAEKCVSMDKTVALSHSESSEAIINVDTVILHRILENIFENAARFAQNTVTVEFELQEHILQITIIDDGKGFSEEVLRKRKKSFLPTQEEGHLGMGLAISRVLCEKHGGSLQFGNAVPQGGVVVLRLSVH